MASILITGASGFIGSFLVEEALRQGMETWACVRASSSRRYLKDSRIGFFEADLGDTQALRVRLLRHRQEHGRLDAHLPPPVAMTDHLSTPERP